jgi:hypothetical protein
MMVFKVILFITVFITCIVSLKSGLAPNSWRYWGLVCSLAIANICGLLEGYYCF